MLRSAAYGRRALCYIQRTVLRSLSVGMVNSAADHQKCKIVDPPSSYIKGNGTVFTIITKDGCTGGSHVSVQLRGVDGTTLSCESQQVGEVKLSVFSNGQQSKRTPNSVTVKDYTSVNKPRKVVNIDGSMGKPWGIAFSKNGMWAVADWYNHCVRIFDGEDQLVRKFGSHGSGDGQFIYPRGVAFDSDDHLYVADHGNHRVQKFTIDGKYLLQFGGEGSDEGKLFYPKGLAVHNHKVYVANSVNKRISVFQSDGKFLHTIGSGQLGLPIDVTVNGDNQLLVADRDHHCIYTFTMDGDYLGKFGTCGTGRGKLKYARVVAVDAHGFILATDSYNDRVSIFDKYGNFVHCFGSEGSAVGQFDYPCGIAVSANGDIYVSDLHNKRVQIFS